MLTYGHLGNAGTINVSGTDNSLDGETVTANNALEIIAGGALTLDQGTTFANDGGKITVDATGTLTVADTSSITGGRLVNLGDLHVENSTGALLDGVDVDNTSGAIHIDANGPSSPPPAKLIIDHGTSIKNGSVDIGSVGTLEVSDGGATLTGGVTINVTSGGIIQIDGGDTLKLDGASISGGTINDFSPGATTGSIIAGDIDITGSSSISGAHLNNGRVTVASGKTLTLDNDTVTGTAISAANATIQVDGNTTLNLDGVSITGGTINDFSPGATTGSIIAADIDIIGDSSISGAHLNNGRVTVASGKTLTLDNDTVTSTAISAANATIQVDGNTTLNLDGASITGGTINDFSPGATTGSIIAGDIDITGSSSISGAHLNNGRVTVASGKTLTL